MKPFVEANLLRGSFREKLPWKLFCLHGSIRESSHESCFDKNVYGQAFVEVKQFHGSFDGSLHGRFHGSFHGSFRGSELRSRKLPWKQISLHGSFGEIN